MHILKKVSLAYKNLLKQDNVYTLLTLYSPISTPFGLDFWDISENSSRNHTIYVKLGSQRFIRVCSYTFLMILLIILIVTTNVFEGRLENYIRIQSLVFGIIGQITFCHRSPSFLDVFARVSCAEVSLRVLKKRTNYSTIYNLIFFQYFAIIVGIIVFYHVSSRAKLSMGSFLMQLTIFGLPLMIFCWIITMSIGLGVIIWSKFRILNSYLNDEIMSTYSKPPKIGMKELANIHFNLVESCNKLVYSISYVLLCCHLSCYSQFLIMFMEIFNIRQFKLDKDIYLGATEWFIFNMTMMTLLTYIKYMSSKAANLISEMEFAYFDEIVGTERNTFHLQLLHQKVDLNLFGGFEFDIGKLSSSITIFLNLLIFLVQLSGPQN